MGLSEIVAYNFRPKLPAPTIYGSHLDLGEFTKILDHNKILCVGLGTKAYLRSSKLCRDVATSTTP